MDSILKDVLLGTAEVLTSSITGASICAPIPPLALLMLPVCAASSLTSVGLSAIANRALGLEENDKGARFAVKTVTLLVGTAAASAICVGVLAPITLGAAALVVSVIAIASIVGAVTALIIDEAPDVYSPGYNSYSLNVGYAYQPSRPSYGSSFSSHIPSRFGSSARGFGGGRSGVPARGFDVDRR